MTGGSPLPTRYYYYSESRKNFPEILCSMEHTMGYVLHVRNAIEEHDTSCVNSIIL